MFKKKIPFLTACFLLAYSGVAMAATNPNWISINVGSGTNTSSTSSTIETIIGIALISLAPSLLIMFTSFTQIIITLSLTRQGLGTATQPPNQVLVGLAIFLTLYIMSPVLSTIYDNAWVPLQNNQITMQQAVDVAEPVLIRYMVDNTYTTDLQTFYALDHQTMPKNIDQVSIWSAVPAFTVSQITKGFFSGLMIYIAFLFIDMMVASVLMFMGMMMLPPQMISLPLKLLIFVYLGGFTEIIKIIFQTIHP